MNNIIFVILDCLRPSIVYSKDIMPFFSTLFNNAGKNKFGKNIFTHAPSTPFSIPTILTGRLPFSLTNRPGVNTYNKSAFLPYYLEQKLGYKTFGISGNVMISRYFNYDQIFTEFEDFQDRVEITNTGRKRLSLLNNIKKYINNDWLKKLYHNYRITYESFLKQDLQNTSFDSKIRGNIIIDTFIKKIKLRERKNFFYLHFMEPHAPYGIPNSVNKKTQKLALKWQYYKNNINNFTDKEIEELFILYKDEVQVLDSYLNTIYNIINEEFKNDFTIIFLADHGESFFETNYLGHPDDKIFNVMEQMTVPFAVISGNNNIEPFMNVEWTSDITKLIKNIITKEEISKEKSIMIGYKRSSNSNKLEYLQDFKPIIVFDLKQKKQIMEEGEIKRIIPNLIQSKMKSKISGLRKKYNI